MQPAYPDTNESPTSSWHSLTAAWSSVSSGSCLPPGSAMSPLHLSLYARRKIRDVRKSLYPVYSTIYHFKNSYFGPGSNSCVRQDVSYTAFSKNNRLFMGFVRNTSQSINSQLSKCCRVLLHMRVYAAVGDSAARRE